MQRAEKCKEIIRKFESDVERLYKEAWKQIDELYDDEYEQNLSYPWLNMIQNQFNFGFKHNKLDKT